MPLPFAIAPIVTVFPPNSNSTATSFKKVSVVIIPPAASLALCLSSFNCGDIFLIPFSIISIGISFPIMPVAAVKTSSELT